MGCLRDLYGYRNKTFRDGVKAGIELYAYWKDGKQYVGNGMRLADAIAEVDEELIEEEP